jgi:hypothetical protein
MAFKSAFVAVGPPMIAAGSPGAKCIEAKTKKEIPSNNKNN